MLPTKGLVPWRPLELQDSPVLDDRPLLLAHSSRHPHQVNLTRCWSRRLAKSKEESIEDQIKRAEKMIMRVVEESCRHASDGNKLMALEKAKDAARKERQMGQLREQASAGELGNLDLTYCVLFNMATQYHLNGMYQEALSAYSAIVKNKLFTQSGRLRVNMGNIYHEQKMYTQAIKMYHMALDQIPMTNKEMRCALFSYFDTHSTFLVSKSCETSATRTCQWTNIKMLPPPTKPSWKRTQIIESVIPRHFSLSPLRIQFGSLFLRSWW